MYGILRRCGPRAYGCSQRDSGAPSCYDGTSGVSIGRSAYQGTHVYAYGNIYFCPNSNPGFDNTHRYASAHA